MRKASYFVAILLAAIVIAIQFPADIVSTSLAYAALFAATAYISTHCWMRLYFGMSFRQNNAIGSEPYTFGNLQTGGIGTGDRCFDRRHDSIQFGIAIAVGLCWAVYCGGATFAAPLFVIFVASALLRHHIKMATT